MKTSIFVAFLALFGGSATAKLEYYPNYQSLPEYVPQNWDEAIPDVRQQPSPAFNLYRSLQMPIQDSDFYPVYNQPMNNYKLMNEYEESDRVPEEEEEPEFTYNLESSPVEEDGLFQFAVTPGDKRYYESNEDIQAKIPIFADNKRALPEKVRAAENQRDDGSPSNIVAPPEDTFQEPRKQRQNPNLASKMQKVDAMDLEHDGVYASHVLGKFASERDIPTSLIPTSARRQHVLQQAMRPNPSVDRAMNIYIYSMVAGVSAAITIAIAAFGFGWYTMQKKTKAAADVEYPAYGVTGPRVADVSPSGDRRLAHSAQMYHYQHQKQQIIAMENNRAGVAERNGSVSDAESEEENEEGDYTVYECPGFATTGEMEVKNPLFVDEPTPATPAVKNAAKEDVERQE